MSVISNECKNLQVWFRGPGNLVLKRPRAHDPRLRAVVPVSDSSPPAYDLGQIGLQVLSQMESDKYQAHLFFLEVFFRRETSIVHSHRTHSALVIRITSIGA